ncbi:MAG: V-type ATPase subunit [Acidilobus sp.]
MSELMGSPSLYAKVVPRLRALKAGLLGPRVRDLAPPLAEALASLRESAYSSISDAKDIRTLERKIAQLFFSAVDELDRLSPDEAKPLVSSFALMREVEDIFTVARALAEGSSLPKWLPSVEWSSSEIGNVIAELEASPSITRLPDTVKGSQLRRLLTEAMQAFSEVKSPEVFTWYSLSAQASTLLRALDSIGGQDRVETEKVICPLIEERVGLAAVEAWVLSVNPRTFARVLPERTICGLSWAALSSAYERNLGADVISLAMDVSGILRYVKAEGKGPRDIMASIRRTARVTAVRAANAQYEGYPYTPALLAAALVLLSVDLDNLRSALLGIGLGLTQQEIEAALA